MGIEVRKIEAGDICENGSCGHPATTIWLGDGGSLAVTRDSLQEKWCLCCMATAQYEYALAILKNIPHYIEEMAAPCGA